MPWGELSVASLVFEAGGLSVVIYDVFLYKCLIGSINNVAFGSGDHLRLSAPLSLWWVRIL